MTISKSYSERRDAWKRLQESDERFEWEIAPWLECCLHAQQAFASLASGIAIDDEVNVSGWPALSVFENLAFYGLYGDLLERSNSTEPAEQVERWLQLAKELRSKATFRCDDGIVFKIISLAEGRRNLECGEGVIEPLAVALLGGVSEGRVRNLMSGSAAEFKAIEGGIPVAHVQAWLQGRGAFWPSNWHREQQEEKYMEVIRVPQASDGTVFHPGLRRRSGYMVGEKGSEQTIEDFDAALDTLTRMDEPRWRRPNAQGNWGIVKGVEWVTFSRRDLNAIKG